MNNKKQQILDAALHLFAEQGIEGTPTAQIAKSAGVAKGTLFHHFDNKAMLVDELFVHLKHTLHSVLFDLPTSKPLHGASSTGLSDNYLSLQQIWQLGMNWAMANPVAMAFFCQVHFHPASHIRNASVAETFEPLMPYICSAQQGDIVKPLDIAIVRDFCHHHFLHSAHFLISSTLPTGMTHTDYINTSFDMLWRAIGGSVPVRD